MSLILDALRKMEQERKARQGGGIDIRPEVLGHHRAEAPRRSSGMPIILVAAGIAILAAGVGGGIMLKKGPPDKAPEQSRPAVRSEPLPSAEVVPAAVSPQTLPPAPVEPPAAAAPPKPALLPAPAAVPAPTPVQRPAMAEQPALPSEYPAGEITVSGIAWQEERSLRRAVVNGTLVGEGAEVAGARVVEIGERRVKFSQGGRTISVSLSSPFPGR